MWNPRVPRLQRQPEFWRHKAEAGGVAVIAGNAGPFPGEQRLELKGLHHRNWGVIPLMTAQSFLGLPK